jgi:hypothetical protein
MFSNFKTKQSTLDSLDQFDDELWVELMVKSPQSVISICIMISLDIQLEKEMENIKIN